MASLLKVFRLTATLNILITIGPECPSACEHSQEVSNNNNVVLSMAFPYRLELSLVLEFTLSRKGLNKRLQITVAQCTNHRTGFVE